MENKVFQYVQFSSFVNADFWYKLAEIKLNIDRLNDSKRHLHAIYSNFNSKSCLLEVDCSAFNAEFKTTKNYFKSHGTLLNKNTKNDFKDCDKKSILRETGQEEFYNNILNGKCLEDPSRISVFLILSFADLKNHNFFYWFAFPSAIDPILHVRNEAKPITKVLTAEDFQKFSNNYKSIEDQKQLAYFIANEKLDIIQLKDVISHVDLENNLKDLNLDSTYFCFADPSEFSNPGWNLRNFMFVLLKLCPILDGKSIKVLSVRLDAKQNLNPSIIFELDLSGIKRESLELNEIKWIGWEKNEHGNFGPRLAPMSSLMDPVKLSQHFSNFNLKLMKWRLVPDLNLDLIKSQKCLLLGAGTLGCAIARDLLSWGVEQITFVDYGNVSYSNPTRQCLFTHEDAAKNKKKAQTAADRIKEIMPTVNSVGHVLQIPMPGHTVGPSMMEKTLENIECLKELINGHDVIFLLTDSRESRWFPTLLGAFYKKFVITTALGFDSYLVLRHGSRLDNDDTGEENLEVENLKCIAGNKLSCYFCNDITAPGNSMKDRTLDQQCTVTRPGVSNIAAALAVELMVAVLQHEKKNLAPAYYKTMNKSGDQDPAIPEGILGILPHSIRGYLTSFQNILPATENFSQCVACSQKVLDEYKAHGNEFLLKVLESSKYLEEVTGIDEMENIDNDIINYDDMEFDSDVSLDA